MQPPADFRPSGFCECGCGQRTPIAKQSRPRYQQYAGYPLRYVLGHNPRGKRAHGWKGGRKVNNRGYILIWMPEHPCALKGGYIYEHRLVWEVTHGCPLEPHEHIHHIDGNPSNNAPKNLLLVTPAEHREQHATNPRVSESLFRYYSDPAVRTAHSERMRLWWQQRKRQAKAGH